MKAVLTFPEAVKIAEADRLCIFKSHTLVGYIVTHWSADPFILVQFQDDLESYPLVEARLPEYMKNNIRLTIPYFKERQLT